MWKCQSANTTKAMLTHQASRRRSMGSNVDISGNRRQAKPACGCPLDGRVRRHAGTSAQTLHAEHRTR